MSQASKRYMPCPCDSKQLYHKCCKLYHDGTPAPNAERLMRSRYCAYALGLVDYVLATTHRDNPSYTTDMPQWRASAQSFCQATTFVGLQVLSFEDGEDRAFVVFTATLRQGGRDASFTERSSFVREDGRWLYLNGELLD